MIGAVRAAVRTAWKTPVLAVMVLAVIPSQLLVLAFTRGPGSLALPALFHRLFCRVLGIAVETTGAPATAARAVYICNHLSHLDVSVIGGVVKACFVAKEDVRGWPLFGGLSKLQQTVFISRNPRRVAEAVAVIRRALGAGHRLVLFPEGTTSDGSSVLPFKSSSFAVLAEPEFDGVVLQPVTIRLLEVDGVRVDHGADRDIYAYHGGMTLVPHLLRFLAGAGARVRLEFHPPLSRASGQTRKQLAAAAHARVAGAEAPAGA